LSAVSPIVTMVCVLRVVTFRTVVSLMHDVTNVRLVASVTFTRVRSFLSCMPVNPILTPDANIPAGPIIGSVWDIAFASSVGRWA
jgi:hypothetical protein